MTALTQYERLEATGVYAAGKGAQRRDVILSLGQASLTIADQSDSALAHWSLAAIERLNPGRLPALYAPAPNTPERVETTDPDMIAAIEKVRTAVERGRPHPGRLRLRLLIAAIAAGIAVAVFWLPGALVTTTARIVPDAARQAIGAAVLNEITTITGRPCNDPAGAAALSRMLGALRDAGPRAALVLPGGPAGAHHVPGGTVLLNRSVVEDHESPPVVAGHLLAEAQRAEEADPLVHLLDEAGLLATLRLATTGNLPEAAVTAHAERLLTAPPAPVPADALAARFRRAGVPLTPYAYALDITGESTLPLIEADSVPPDQARPLVTDTEWVALQGICGP